MDFRKGDIPKVCYFLEFTLLRQNCAKNCNPSLSRWKAFLLTLVLV